MDAVRVHSTPPGETLFDRAAFKEALPEVSKIRLEQTLFAEYPTLKPLIEKLDQQKTQQTQATLARIWEMSEVEARSAAESLADVGFFERRTAKDRPVYWVPFLYRDALNMVQGSSDAAIPDDGAVAEQTSLLVDGRPSHRRRAGPDWNGRSLAMIVRLTRLELV